MSAGIPLDDDDRWPWLDSVGAELAAHRAVGVVIACSALRRSYRDRIRSCTDGVVFVHLAGSEEVLLARATSREGHFMPVALLASQLALLEPLAPDERGGTIDVDAGIDGVVDAAARWALADAER